MQTKLTRTEAATKTVGELIATAFYALDDGGTELAGSALYWARQRLDEATTDERDTFEWCRELLHSSNSAWGGMGGWTR